MLSSHLPALQIALPLAAAPLCVLLPRRLVFPFVLAVSWGSLGLAAMLLSRVIESGAFSYALGGWSAPWGIEYRLDLINAFVMLLVALIGAVVLAYAPASVAREIAAENHPHFYAAFLLCLTGLLGIGTIEFSCAGDSIDVMFADIWKAQRVKALVRGLQDSNE